MTTTAPPDSPATPEDRATALAHDIAVIHEELAVAVERATLVPLRAAFGEAADAHAATLRLLGLGDDARAPESVGRAIARYRAAVCDRVLGPIGRAFDDVDPGSAVGAAWQEARARLDALVSDVPEHLEGPEPEGLFDAGPADGMGDRARKALVRTWRMLARRRDAGTTRDVPFSSLVQWHLHARLPSYQATLIEALSGQAATVVSRVHRGFDAWAPVVLRAEVSTDDPSLHRPHDAPERTVTEDAAAAFESVQSAANQLQAALERAADTAPDPAVEDALLALGGAEDAFLDDVRRSGSILARRRAASGDRLQKAGRAVDRRLDLWSAWHGRVRGSLRALAIVFHFRLASNEVIAGLNGAAGDAARSLTARLGATARSLRASRSETAVECDRAGADAQALHEVLQRVSDRVTEIVAEGLVAPFAERTPGQGVRDAVDRRLASLFAAIEELPEEIVVQGPPEGSAAPDPTQGQERRRPRGLSSESFDVLQLEGLRQAGEMLAAALDQAAAESMEVESVIDFNLQAAIAELVPPDPDAVDETGTRQAAGEGHSEDAVVAEPVDPIANARELVVTGLERAAEMLERTAAEADALVRPFTEATFETIQEGWTEIVSRFEAEDTVHERVRDVRFLVRARLRRISVRTLSIGRDAWKYTATWGRKGRVKAEQLLRLSQYAVEGERMTGEDRRVTLEALADADRLLADLPLVYRRLFGFQVIADRLAVEGRATEFGLVRVWHTTWKEGLTDALILSGWPGGGMSSFFAAALQSVAQEGTPIQTIRLGGRVTDEAALCALLTGELGIEDAPDLDALADAILAADGGLPVIGIEGLEMLLMRSSSDNGLISAFLTFLSRTDSCVLWIATISRAAWTYIESVDPTPCGLVRHLPLAPLTRDDLESVILGRHKRSGLRLEFDAHQTYSPLMRRRLRRAPTESDRQAILREDFFDHLARVAGSSIVLALFYWLRSAYIGQDQNTLRIRPFTPLSFAFLGDLGAEHAFALKAFLEHGTLTVVDLERVLFVTREDSREIFASLVNLLLIEREHPATGTGRAAIPVDVPYRIRSLVLQPVLTMLKARNLVR